MLFRRKRRSVPGLNTTSTADISFMLLVFFLVTTSMDADKGMKSKLPPVEIQKHEVMDVDRSKVLDVHLYGNGEVTLNEMKVDVSNDKLLRRELKKFILKNGVGHIIDVKCESSCDYNTYFSLQNEILRSYRELRENAAMQKFERRYSQCSEEQKMKLDEMYPQRVHETY